MKIWEYHRLNGWSLIDLPMSRDCEEGEDQRDYYVACGFLPRGQIGDNSEYGVEMFEREGCYIVNFTFDYASWNELYCPDYPSYLLCLKNIVFPLVKASSHLLNTEEYYNIIRKVFTAWHGHDVFQECSECHPLRPRR